MLLATLCVFSSSPVMAEDSSPSTAAINTSTWPISEEQAIEIASAYLPADAVEQAQISVVIVNGGGGKHIWQTVFSSVAITGEELNWAQITDTSLSPESVCYEYIQIDVSAVTGDVVSKYAASLPVSGSLPVATKVIEPSVFFSPYWLILGGVALFLVWGWGSWRAGWGS